MKLVEGDHEEAAGVDHVPSAQPDVADLDLPDSGDAGEDACQVATDAGDPPSHQTTGSASLASIPIPLH